MVITRSVSKKSPKSTAVMPKIKNPSSKRKIEFAESSGHKRRVVVEDDDDDFENVIVSKKKLLNLFFLLVQRLCVPLRNGIFSSGLKIIFIQRFLIMRVLMSFLILKRI
ncbi:uncharacterized protein LOC126655573 [Mercurialis annua]|uniref:uncharacterized protein LOC126655490 n=1 Tax=Mercurialis annua TaxID=3986 RepID=UPI002160142C|nr:uncharacterized protein LOC126655490 [Mercurialis annua]XP_050205763.1 uncharacterized protein LOC126655573 [Mercurialis annua]